MTTALIIALVVLCLVMAYRMDKHKDENDSLHRAVIDLRAEKIKAERERDTLRHNMEHMKQTMDSDEDRIELLTDELACHKERRFKAERTVERVRAAMSDEDGLQHSVQLPPIGNQVEGSYTTTEG